MIAIHVDPVKLLAAAELASYAHRHKKDKLPYIHHPIQVAQRLAQAAAVDSAKPLMDRYGDNWVEPTLLASLVHDVMEDTDTSEEEIEDIIGTLATSIAKEVTDPDDMPKDTVARKAKQAEKAADYSLGATNLKISDQTRNLFDVMTLKPNWSEQKIVAYANGAKQIVEATPVDYRLPQLEQEFMATYKLLIKKAPSLGV